MLTNNTKERVTITPEMAKEMLTHNTHNRPVKKSAVEKLYIAIVNGLWNYDGTPICFDVNETLIDGQHRLLACVKAGIPIICDIKYNLPVDAFKTKDVFANPRGGSDIFNLCGVACGRNTSAIVSAYTRICKGSPIEINKDQPYIRMFKGVKSITPYELYEIYNKDREVFDDCRKESYNNYQFLNLWSSTLEGAFMAYLILQRKHPSSKVFDFFEQLHYVEKTRFDAIRYAYNRLIKHRTGQQLCTAQMIQATIIKAWNAYITNKDRKTITFYPDKEEMPEWI